VVTDGIERQGKEKGMEGMILSLPEGVTVTSTLDSGVVSRPTDIVCDVISWREICVADTRNPGPNAVTDTTVGTATSEYVLSLMFPVDRMNEMLHAPSVTWLTVKLTPPVSRATSGPLTVATLVSDETAVTVTGSSGRVSKLIGSMAKEVGCTVIDVKGMMTAGAATETLRTCGAVAPW